MADNAKRDENRTAAILAKSNSANEVLALLADAITQRLLKEARLSMLVS
jgi:hypothetical protein